MWEFVKEKGDANKKRKQDKEGTIQVEDIELSWH